MENLAQAAGIKGLIQAIGSFINPLIKLIIAVGLLVFFWGLVKFIFRIGGSEKAVEEARRLMIWSIAVMFVMVSAWGIIRFFQIELGLPQTVSPEPGEDIRNFNPFESPRLESEA